MGFERSVVIDAYKYLCKIISMLSHWGTMNLILSWRKVGIHFKARKLDNRANANIEALGLGDRAFVRVPFFVIPYWRAWVMWNGDMIVCCVDQERSNWLGNCTQHSIPRGVAEPGIPGIAPTLAHQTTGWSTL
jgi:hypothetical protein